MRYLLLLTILVILSSPAIANDVNHSSSNIYSSKFAVGDVLPSLVVQGRQQINLTGTSYSSPTIIIRYLGYTCRHCVEQLTYLNRNANALKKLGIHVVAFSSDDIETIEQMIEIMKYDTSVISFYSDPDNNASSLLGSTRVENNSEIDLHAAVVVYKGVVGMSVLSSEPYMDIQRLVSTAAAMRNTKNTESVQSASSHPADRYLAGTVHVTTIAGPADGINQPLDLDFNHSPLSPYDLWVVNTGASGNAIAILHNAPDETSRVIRVKKDSRASHFMWRTHAIAMGSNGTFATAQNGAPGNFNPFYQFMGPTLWSSDTAVFASRYQDDKQILASHLDMLHQSPMNLGIAHDHDNAYWVSDAYYNDITLYDFKDPHEVGGTDHRDGIIHRYADAHVSAGELGEPGHIALDKNSGYLYIVDPGANIVTRMNTKTGAFIRNLVAPPESMENLAEYSEWKGALVDTVLADSLGEPVGIEVNRNRLFVGDRASGNIRVYSITNDTVQYLGSIQTGAKELLGICYGPDEHLWFVDRASSTVGRLDTELDAFITANRDVVAVDRSTTIAFTYHGSEHDKTVAVQGYIRTVDADGQGDWTELPFNTQATVPGNAVHEFNLPVVLPDTVHSFEVELREILDDGSDGRKAKTIVVPNTITRAIVDDAILEEFRITQAVAQTNRVGYVSLRSDVFVRIAQDLPNLKTVLWNGGSFGEISTTDDAVINGLINRKIDLMVIADDPLLLRTDLPSSGTFFNKFGVRLRGVDQVSPDNGQRVFQGVVGDTITSDMKNVLFSLPRLDHHRGNSYIPNVLFVRTSDSTKYVLQANDSSRVVAARYEIPEFRSVILGVNASRFQNGVTRTTFLDRALEWLEMTTIPDTSQPTSVNISSLSPRMSLQIAGNVTSSQTMATLMGTASDVNVGLYTINGQRIADVYVGNIEGSKVLPINISSMAIGTYFVIARTNSEVVYQTVIKQ